MNNVYYDRRSVVLIIRWIANIYDATQRPSIEYGICRCPGPAQTSRCVNALAPQRQALSHERYKYPSILVRDAYMKLSVLSRPYQYTAISNWTRIRLMLPTLAWSRSSSGTVCCVYWGILCKVSNRSSMMKVRFAVSWSLHMMWS